MSSLSPIDALDTGLLLHLDRNARVSYADLSRALKVPQETIRYRVNALRERGIIESFIAVVDPGKLQAEVHKVLLKCRNVDEARLEKIIEGLLQHGDVNWVARFDGLFDIGFTIWVKRIRDLSTFVDELRWKHHRYIHRIALATNIEAEFFSRTFGTREFRTLAERSRYTSPELPLKVDEIDLHIVQLLSADPRSTATEVARKVGVTSETVLTRIAKLEKTGVITGYRLVLNSSAMGQLNYYTLVYLQSTSRKRLQEFLDFCRRHQAITYLIKALGEWDYELNIEVGTALEYRSLMMSLTKEFSDVVREYYSLDVGKVHKFSIMPPGRSSRARS